MNYPSTHPRLHYVPVLSGAGEVLDKVYVRAPNKLTARDKALELRPTAEYFGPVEELSDVHVAALNLTETTG